MIIKNINRSEINIDFVVTMDINYDYYLDAITVEKSKKIIGKTYINLFDLTLKLQNYGLSLDFVHHYVEKELLKIAWKIQVNTYDLKALIVENNNLISKPKTRIKVK